jgi:hypothetical protein
MAAARRRWEAAGVTAGPVRCSAWLGLSFVRFSVFKFLLFAAGLVDAPNLVGDGVEVGNVLGNEQSWKRVTCRPVGSVCGDGADNLNAALRCNGFLDRFVV